MKFNKLFIILSAITSIFVSNIQSPVVAETTQVTSTSSTDVQWTNDDFGDYYKSLFESSSSSLSSNLTSLISSTHKTLTTYDGLLSVFNKADVDPNNSNNILWFYTGTSVSKPSNFSGSTNREHVWPKDGGDAFPEKTGPGADGHHLRPTDSQLNSTRGSLSFGEVAQTTSNIVKQNGSTTYGKTADELCYKSGSFFYPAKGYRGQTARIIFYMASRWGSQYNLKMVSGAGNCKTIGDLPTLLKWNLEEPVCETEVFRNNEVAKIQGNRNPFIDNPHLACAIWGNSYSGCSNCNSIVNPYDGNIVLPDNPGDNTGGNTGGNTGDSGNTGSIVNWGTASNPLTTAQAIANMSSFEHNQTSSTSGYVKGVVTSVDEVNSTYSNITLTLDDKFTIYRCSTPKGTYDENNPEVKVGDEIVVSGTFKKFYEKYEIDQGGSIISINSSGSTTPDTPIVPDDPIVPDNPEDGGNTTKESISFDFSNVGLSDSSYTDGVKWNIEGQEYYASHSYVKGNDVRLGHNNAKTLDSKFGISATNGSYLEPLFDLDKCKSISLEVKAKYGTTSYKVLFKEKNSSTYSVIKEGNVEGSMTIEASLSSPKDGRFIIVIVGTKPRIQLGQFSINIVETPSIDLSSLSLIVHSSIESDKELLKFTGNFDKKYLQSATRFGIFVFSKNQLGNKTIKDLYTGGDYQDFIIDNGKYDYLDFDFSHVTVNSYGAYVFTASINNVKGHEDYEFVAVVYAEIGDELYFSNQIITSYNDAK